MQKSLAGISCKAFFLKTRRQPVERSNPAAHPSWRIFASENRQVISGCYCREEFIRRHDWDGIGHVIGLVPCDEAVNLRIDGGIVLHRILEILEIGHQRKINRLLIHGGHAEYDSDLFEHLHCLVPLEFLRKDIKKGGEAVRAQISIQLLRLDYSEYPRCGGIKRLPLKENVQNEINVAQNGFQRYFSSLCLW